MKFTIAATLAVACLSAQAAIKPIAYYDQTGKRIGPPAPGSDGPAVYALYRSNGLLATFPLQADVNVGGMVPYDYFAIYYATNDCSGPAYLPGQLWGAPPALWKRTASGDLLLIADSTRAEVSPPNFLSYWEWSDGCQQYNGTASPAFKSSSAPVKLNIAWPLVLH